MRQVQIGQIWHDKDRRRVGRKFEVISLGINSAECNMLSKSDGVSRARNRTKIRLDRFKPKYYILEHDAAKPRPGVPPLSSNELYEKCQDILSGTWGGYGSYVTFNNDTIAASIREVRTDCYDVKARINDHLVYSNVVNNNIEEATYQLKNYLVSLRDKLSNVID